MARVTTKEAYQLLHDGVKAFATVEQNGMRVDVDYLKRMIEVADKKIARLAEHLKEQDEFHIQQKRFGRKAKLTARDQLAQVLFQDLDHTCRNKTETGRYQLDDTALQRIGTPYTRGFLRLMKLDKLRGTYLKGVLREVEGEYVHCFFNLNLVKTFRSSCDRPNLQNIPIRDPEIGRIIRQAFIPRPGHVLAEVDISGAEVRVAACYHQDPVMLEYIRTGHDLHRDMAIELFNLPKEEVTKQIRFIAKGSFVFAEFYGDYFESIAGNILDDLRLFPLDTESGVPLLDHMKKKGIKSPKQFEAHVRVVEEAFWGERFRVYNEWKHEWHEEYLRRGGFRTLTGFWIEGVFKRNDVINYPIQGSAFHCLLWGLIRIQRELRQRKMKTKIVGQIHDSIIADVPEDELERYLAIVKRVMTEDLPAEWKWIITPIEIEAEVGKNNWFEKEEVKI